MSEPTIHIKQWKQIKLAISKKNVTNETIKSLLQATDGYLKDVYNSNLGRKKTILETINLIGSVYHNLLKVLHSARSLCSQHGTYQ